MGKQIIRLTESDLKNIVRKSVGKILREFGSDGPDFADYEVPGYEGTNVPDGLEYNELDASEDFDDFLSDSQYIREPNIGKGVKSASDFDTDDALLDFSSKRRFGESKKKLGRIIRESIKKVLNETEVYPGWDSTTTGDYGAQEEPSDMKPQGHESEEDERRRHERFLRKIYAGYGLPNGLGKGNSDDIIVGNNELASKTDLKRAFGKYFLNRFKDAPEGFKAYEVLFKNYISDPLKIYKWFEKNGIDYKKYLEDADDSRVVRMKY